MTRQKWYWCEWGVLTGNLIGIWEKYLSKFDVATSFNSKRIWGRIESKMPLFLHLMLLNIYFRTQNLKFKFFYSQNQAPSLESGFPFQPEFKCTEISFLVPLNASKKSGWHLKNYKLRNQKFYYPLSETRLLGIPWSSKYPTLQHKVNDVFKQISNRENQFRSVFYANIQWHLVLYRKKLRNDLNFVLENLFDVRRCFMIRWRKNLYDLPVHFFFRDFLWSDSRYWNTWKWVEVTRFSRLLVIYWDTMLFV